MILVNMGPVVRRLSGISHVVTDLIVTFEGLYALNLE